MGRSDEGIESTCLISGFQVNEVPTEAASGVVDARPLAQPVSATGTLPGIV